MPFGLQLLSQCQNLCLLKDGLANGRLTETELRLAQRLAAGEAATDEWIAQTEKMLTGTNRLRDSIVLLY